MIPRDIKLDLAKGLLIILVVIGHSIQYSFGGGWLLSEEYYGSVAYKAIYSFHMPLFMMISGFLFYESNKKRPFRELVLSKIKSLGIPLLSFGFICNFPAFVNLINGGGIFIGIIKFIRLVLFGWSMWFLMSLLINTITIAIITKVFHNRKVQAFFMMSLSIGFLFFSDTLFLSVYKFMFPFFCIGYLVKQEEINIYKYSNNAGIVLGFTILSIASIIWFDTDTYVYTTGIYLNGNAQHQLFIDIKRFVIALVVSFTFMQYIKFFSECNLSSIKGKIQRIGQASLFIYGFNIIFDTYYSHLALYVPFTFKPNVFIPVLFTIIVLSCAYYLYVFLTRNKLTRLCFTGKS